MTDRQFLLVSAACLGAILGGFWLAPHPYLRALVAVPVVFVLPGTSLLRALGVRLSAGMDQAALATGLSLALTVLGGLLLGFAGMLTPTGWSFWLGGTTIAGAMATLWRPSVSVGSAIRVGLKPRHALLLAAAIAAFVATGTIATRQYQAYRPFPYTNFWMIAQSPTEVTIGISNGEGRPQEYEIDLMVDGAIVGIWRGLRLDPSQTLTKHIALPPGRKAEAWLFNREKPSEVFRKVTAVLNNGSADDAGASS